MLHHLTTTSTLTPSPPPQHHTSPTTLNYRRRGPTPPLHHHHPPPPLHTPLRLQVPFLVERVGVCGVVVGVGWGGGACLRVWARVFVHVCLCASVCWWALGVGGKAEGDGAMWWAGWLWSVERQCVCPHVRCPPSSLQRTACCCMRVCHRVQRVVVKRVFLLPPLLHSDERADLIGEVVDFLLESHEGVEIHRQALGRELAS